MKEDILLDALQIVEHVRKEQQRSVSRVFVVPLLHSPDVCKVLKGSRASSCCMRRKVVEQVLQPIALRWSSLSTTNPFWHLTVNLLSNRWFKHIKPAAAIPFNPLCLGCFVTFIREVTCRIPKLRWSNNADIWCSKRRCHQPIHDTRIIQE